jgi:DnaJ-class molecular chaperone with C-terminal Zn finger domain
MTHYALLGVTAQATLEELTAARRRVALAHHPDRNPAPASAALMAAANVAFDTLSDEKAHKAYRLGLRKTHVECGRCHGHGVFKRQKGFTKSVMEACPVCKGVGMVPRMPERRRK